MLTPLLSTDDMVIFAFSLENMSEDVTVATQHIRYTQACRLKLKPIVCFQTVFSGLMHLLFLLSEINELFF